MGIRSTLRPDKLTQLTGFGKQEGTARVDGARFKVIQHQMGAKRGGGLVTPMFVLQFDETYLNQDLKEETPGAGTETHDMILCWGDKETKEAKLRFFPANVTGPDDDNPEEVGTSDIDGNDQFKMVEIDSEGNTFVSIDGAIPFANSDVGFFMASLEKAGFKPEILDQGYAPNFVGLVYDFKSVIKTELAKELGIKYTFKPTDRIKTEKEDVTRKVTKIHVRPYDKAASGKAAGKSTGTAAGGTGGKANGATTSAPAGKTTAEPSEAITASVNAALVPLKGTTLSKTAFVGKIGVHMMKDKSIDAKPGPIAAAFTAQLNKMSDDDFAAYGFDNGFMYDAETKQVTVNE